MQEQTMKALLKSHQSFLLISDYYFESLSKRNFKEVSLQFTVYQKTLGEFKEQLGIQN